MHEKRNRYAFVELLLLLPKDNTSKSTSCLLVFFCRFLFFFDIYLNDWPPFQISIKEIFFLVALCSSRDWKPLYRAREYQKYRLSLSH